MAPVCCTWHFKFQSLSTVLAAVCLCQDYVGFKFHILANFLLHKLAPTLFQGPVFMRMWAEPMPFRQVTIFSVPPV